MNVHETQLMAYQEDVQDYQTVQTKIHGINQTVPLLVVAVVIGLICIALPLAAVMSGLPFHETRVYITLLIGLCITIPSGYKYLKLGGEYQRLAEQRENLHKRRQSRAVISAKKIQEHIQVTNPEMLGIYQILKEYYKIKEVEELE